MDKVNKGIRAAQFGLLVNAGLVVVKLLAGIIGNTYALVADAVESSTDIFSSLIVWRGLRVTARPADETHPMGTGRPSRSPPPSWRCSSSGRASASPSSPSGRS
jgi:divalent metal cation (Fe/Co/Zn/Cd) transporter